MGNKVKDKGRSPVIGYSVAGHVILECGPAHIAITPAIGQSILERLPQTIREARMVRGRVYIVSADHLVTISLSIDGAESLLRNLPGMLRVAAGINQNEPVERKVIYFPHIPAVHGRMN